MSLHMSPEAQIILAARVYEGDRGAEAEVAALFGARLRAMMLAGTRNRSVAEDLTQEALTAALVALRAGRLRADDRLAAFVFGAARNVASDYLRGLGSMDVDPPSEGGGAARMTCAETAGLPARYAAGDLAGAGRARYEAHFFECDDCFRDLETALTAREVAPAGGPRRLTRWLPALIGLIAAGAIAAWWAGGREPFEPPPYDPPAPRGGEPAPETVAFARAIAHYRRGEYKEAASGLEQHLRARPDDPRAVFYLGVSLLAIGEEDRASELLRRAAADAESPYRDQAADLLERRLRGLPPAP